MDRFALAIAALIYTGVATAESPRLVLQITVDGFRGDLLERYKENFGNGGFNYLLDNGMVFTNAHYLHANTETIVGHTTLATGATPAVHGMVGNVWYNGSTGELGYNIEDPDAPLLPTREQMKAGAQVDPAQLKAGSKGRSPRGILAPTFSDTLKISGGRDSKVFGISGKDRSAVAMAGKTGIAYWYSTDSGDFQTSAYYMEQYPGWVKRWNAEGKASNLSGKSWGLLLDQDQYLFAAQDDRPYEVDLKGYGKVFPHAFGPSNHPLFYTRVLVSPYGDSILADFAKTLIEEENIGQDEVTDYLSVSFSGVDAVNHFFGPSSLENEDTVLRLDRTLADLLKYVDKQVGLDNTLIVLSADHGMAEMPEYTSEKGLQAKRYYSHELVEEAKELSEQLFGTSSLIKDFFRPYIYLDEAAIADKGLSTAEVASRLSAGLESLPAIRSAVPSAEAAGYNENAVAHNHHPERSGHIYVYPEPHWFFFDKGAIGVMHGSPWAYDQYVPIIFAGAGIEAGRVSRLVHPIDVAPTLSNLLHLPPSAAAQGKVLPEVSSP